ncbi:MAG TPA: MarR family transcriptional regulator [Thermomicrobiales bacterium]|nr:MarR family transcriptional regulator [Thermomicrobiales bacterium]
MAETTDADRFQALLAAVSRGMKARADRALGEHGARVGQQFILECLWREDDQTPGELAGRIGVETPTVTRAAQRMEAAGLVTRHPDPGDARLVRVRLTARGRALRGVIPAALRRVTDDALRGLTAGERAELERLLERVRRNLAGADGA